jgi:hypothetical protein
MEKQEMKQIIAMLTRIQERMIYREDLEKMMARMAADSKAWREEMEASRNARRKETMACQETMEARLEVEEPASVDTTPEVADDQEVPVEDDEEMPAGEPRKRRRDRRNLTAVRRQKKQERNLDARRRRKRQERAQKKNGCLKNLVAARRGTTRRAVVARRKTLFTKTTRSRLIVAVREVPRRATVARRRRDATKKERDNARRAPGERTPGNRRRVSTEGNTAMKDPDARR